MVKGTYVDKNGVRKGAWTQEEDDKLRAYVDKYGHWNWRLLPKFADLDRCGKSCRLRWMNYLKPGLRREGYTQQEKDLITELHLQHGNKWSAIAAKLPGRTDNGVKNYWHAHLKNHPKTKSGKEAVISELPDGTSCDSVVMSEATKSRSLEHIKTRASSSKVFILESSDPNSTAVPTAVELGSDSPMERSCSNMSSVTSAATQDADNFSDLVVSEFHENFWTQPFMVETDSGHGYDVRVRHEGGNFSSLVDPWWNDASVELL